MDWTRHIKIQRAADALWRGGVIAYPTKAVWGLGCNPDNEEAMLRLLALKSRDAGKGLILVAASMGQFAPYLKGLNQQQLDQLRSSWPGPYTWVVPDNGHTPDLVRGDHDSVALRVSAHPLVVGLCRAFGGPIVSTSCNPQGLAPALNATKVRSYFAGHLDAITPGCTSGLSKPSEIRNLQTGALIR